ncbi:MAG: hypothetical protein M1823_001664 [Watsoniomyces obsoletus]|nr:MAG: hypothetical protein M1823_001664 [Watsoniomyces obsoletus]
MSMFVALQSVLYYVVACSPCRQCAYRRRRKREASLAKRQRKNELETDEPGLYRHPSPFSTNIYWREELAMGPGPPQKKSSKESKGNHSQQQQRRLITAGTGSSLGSATTTTIHGESSTSTMIGSSLERTSVQDRYYERHQREDEVLWGYGGLGNLEGRPDSERRGGGGGRARGTTSPETYSRNPPVNELHPPIVSSQPTTRSESRWMLQPPPSARVMSGKAWASQLQSGKKPGEGIRPGNEHSGGGGGVIEKRPSGKMAERRRRERQPRRDLRGGKSGVNEQRRHRKPAIHFDGASYPEGMEGRGYSSDDDADVEDSGDDDGDEDEMSRAPDSPSLISRRRRSEPPLGTTISSSGVDPPTTPEECFKSGDRKAASETMEVRETTMVSTRPQQQTPLAATTESRPSLKMFRGLVVPDLDSKLETNCGNRRCSSQPGIRAMKPITTTTNTFSTLTPSSPSSPTGNLNLDFKFPCSPLTFPLQPASDQTKAQQKQCHRNPSPPLSGKISINKSKDGIGSGNGKEIIKTDRDMNQVNKEMNINTNVNMDGRDRGVGMGMGMDRDMDMERRMWRWSMDV